MDSSPLVSHPPLWKAEWETSKAAHPRSSGNGADASIHPQLTGLGVLCPPGLLGQVPVFCVASAQWCPHPRPSAPLPHTCHVTQITTSKYIKGHWFQLRLRKAFISRTTPIPHGPQRGAVGTGHSPRLSL